MLGKRAPDISASQITPEDLYANRREFMRMAAGAGVAALAGSLPRAAALAEDSAQAPIAGAAASPLSTSEPWTDLDAITSYNNFYEFGFDKEDPAEFAPRMKTTPWTITVDGLMHARAGDYHIEDILKPHPLEERVYRLRCVETWSMVVPWIGFPLGDLIKRFEPTAEARFVEFQTLYRPAEMPGQRPSWPFSMSQERDRFASMPGGVLEWPYREGLRMDEAMHPLTILAVGLYGKTLLNQNGAPIRLVVPWKYGFKSIKSIVRIRFVRNQPRTAWNVASPREFGFYANVNPDVHRPQNQKTERRIGHFFRQPTLPFNGYAEQVAQLYAGMDLKKHF